MNIKRVLVVSRKSLYQIYVQEHKERSIKQALKNRDAIALALRRSHVSQVASLQRVEQTLRKFKIEAVIRWRSHMRLMQKFDLVISLGGDGTLLDVSRRIFDNTPVLGINSDPTRSVGALCCGTPAILPQLLEGLISGQLRPHKVARLRIRLNGQDILGPTLNDALLAHVCPAGMTRFDMAVVPREEALTAHSGYDGEEFAHFRSSGIWIATATGSTGALHSAGGKVMPLHSRRIQYVIREPYLSATSVKPPLAIQGSIKPDQALVIITRMRRGAIWADGAHRCQPLQYSQQIVIDQHQAPLQLIRPEF
jgi:NAD+ kinase